MNSRNSRQQQAEDSAGSQAGSRTRRDHGRRTWQQLQYMSDEQASEANTAERAADEKTKDRG